MLSPVDEIKSRLDIVDIIQEYVPLKVAGVNMKGLCPFHREKTPSFMVHKGKQMWHCFGCGEGGDMFTFIQKIENVEFPEALEILARKARVELKKENPQVRSERQRLRELLSVTAQWYADVRKGQKGAEALKYLRERRALQDSTIEEWQLGYAPQAWEELSSFLRTRGFRDQEIVAAGMALPGKNRGIYDRFRDRVMFPIRDAHGTVVGFTGRQLHEDKETGGKYVNTPETLLYHKGAVLFGYDKTRQTIREQGYALLVEGQMDVIALWQGGFRNVVAVSGTALTPDQLRLLKRVTDTLVLCFDADPGGSSAASRGIELAWAEGCSVKIVELPEGEAKDPDEMVRKDKDAFARALEQRKPILEYLFTRARAAHPGASVEEKKAVAKALLPALARLADPIEQDHYLKRLSEELGVAEGALRDALKKSASRARKDISSQPHAPAQAPAQSAGERVMALIISFPEALEAIEGALSADALTPPFNALYTDILSWYSESRIHTNDLLTRALCGRHPEATRLINTLAAQGEMQFGDKTESERLEEARVLAQRLERNFLKSKMSELARAIADAERAVARGDNDKKTQLTELTEQFNALTVSLKQIDAGMH